MNIYHRDACYDVYTSSKYQEYFVFEKKMDHIRMYWMMTFTSLYEVI